MIWWENKDLYEEFLYEVSFFPNLSASKVNGVVEINGEWQVNIEGTYVTSYKIQIKIPDNYPEEVPRVYEIGGRIKKVPDFHFNEGDESACLFVQPARWEQWPIGTGIKRFLEKPVKEFFFSQAYRELKGEWPFGDSLHYDEGIIQFYLERLNLKSKSELYPFLEYVKYRTPHRQWKCPCKNGQRYKNCHWNMIKPLIDVLPQYEWDYLKALLIRK